MTTNKKAQPVGKAQVFKFDSELPEDVLALVAKSWDQLISLLIGTCSKKDPDDFLITDWDNDPVNVFLKQLLPHSEQVVYNAVSPREQTLRYMRLVQFCAEHEVTWWREDSFTKIRVDLVEHISASLTSVDRLKAIAALKALS